MVWTNPSTSESKPVKKIKEDRVIAGSVNDSGSLRVEVRAAGKDSYLNRVIKLVEDAQKLKSRTQHLSDRAAKGLTFAALGGGIITLSVWLLLGFEFVYALERMVTVMVISCPHALGLAVPLVAAISTTASAGKGLLIRNRTAFENSRRITMVVFDKTGTLTEGSLKVENIHALNDRYDENELLRLAAAVEQNSEHYIAAGIIKKANEKKIQYPKAGNFKYMPGQGVEGEIEGKKVKAVGPNYIKENNVKLPEHRLNEAVETAVYIIIEDEAAGYVTLADSIREESYGAIKTLKEQKIRNILLTGDNEKTAAHVSEQLGMDGWFANVLPDKKLEKVKELQAEGEFVAVTGDGVNDAPALAQADVGIAVGSGTDIAAETADIILVKSNPQDIVNLILFGRATYQKIVQNLIWAAGYNIVAIPLAAGVLYKYGIILSPAAGAVLMSLSTVIVAVNAQLLRKAIR